MIFVFADTEAETPDTLTNPDAEQTPIDEDSPVSEDIGLASVDEQSPSSDGDEPLSQIKAHAPINEKLNTSIDTRRRHHNLNQRQLAAIDVEHNIPASFIHDTNNAEKIERYVQWLPNRKIEIFFIFCLFAGFFFH